MTWYTLVWAGIPAKRLRRGPWPSLLEATDAYRDACRALARFGGAEAHNVRIAGPYMSRAKARAADISNHPTPHEETQ